MGKKMRLGAFLPGVGQHLAAWRHPDVQPDGHLSLAHHIRLAQTAERGLFDAYFLADGLSVNFGGDASGLRDRSAGFEPVTLFSALSVVTKNIGFIATASTSYEDPYLLARKFASLDHLNGGRTGWNVVTSVDDAAARNFGQAQQHDAAQRYERANEFVDTVSALWDSWEDDAFVRDKASGQFFDPAKLHAPRHQGPYFSVEGPLNVPRSPQGQPVVVQAGQSEPGLELAARTAEVVFTAQQSLEDAQAFYRELKGRLARYGRSSDALKIMPGVSVYVGRTEEEAKAKLQQLNDLIHPEAGLALLAGLSGGVDLSGYPLDGPFPELPKTRGWVSRQQMMVEIARKHSFSVRQLYQWVATARGHWTVVGTASQVADQLQSWFENGAADGFNVLPPILPGSLDEFVDQVIPELQRRGLFRTEYEGQTLRENLGLQRPDNQFAVRQPERKAA